MPLATFTRGSAEGEVQAILKDILHGFSRLEEIRTRMQAELAAGTLDGAGFYPAGDAVAQADKANILGALDDMHAVNGAVHGAALPTLNYLRYAGFLL